MYDEQHEAEMDRVYPAPFRVYPVDYAHEAEQRLEAIYDGETPMVAVEVFDHPLARYGKGEDEPIRFGDRGVWVIGIKADVTAYLNSENLTEWEVQYERAPVEE